MIDDGQHHENVGLQQHDQDVEDRPAQAKDRAEDGAGERRSPPTSRAAGTGFRPRTCFRTAAASATAASEMYSTQVEQEIRRPRAAGVAARTASRQSSCIQPPEPLDLDAVEDHQQPNTESASANVVLTSAVGTLAPAVLMEDVLVDPRHDVDGQEVHRVHETAPTTRP